MAHLLLQRVEQPYYANFQSVPGLHIVPLRLATPKSRGGSVRMILLVLYPVSPVLPQLRLFSVPHQIEIGQQFDLAADSDFEVH